ncbi:hypothetical protein A2U01_0118004, partial [Trifolium medium]|nr:hypothetical protein [Trifolium medium]
MVDDSWSWKNGDFLGWQAYVDFRSKLVKPSSLGGNKCRIM